MRAHPQRLFACVVGALLAGLAFGGTYSVRDLQAATDGTLGPTSTAYSAIDISVPPRVSVQTVVVSESSDSNFICVQLNTPSLHIRVSGAGLRASGQSVKAEGGNCPSPPNSRSWEVPIQRTNFQNRPSPLTLFLEPV